MIKPFFNFFVVLLCSNIATGQLTNELILDLEFENSFVDSSVSNISFVNSGVAFSPDPDGNPNSAGFFGGVNYLSTNSLSLKNQLPFSMSFWIKRDLNNVGGVVFSSDNEFNNYYGYWVAIGPNGEIGTHIAGGLGGATASNRRGFITTSYLQVDVWQHVVVIFRNYNDIDIYFDCVEQPGYYAGSGSTTMVYSSTDSRVGGQIGNTANAAGVFFSGDLDRLKIWKREISLQELGILCEGGQFEITAGVNHVLCSNQNPSSGDIYLNPSIPGTFSYEWSHDSTLNLPYAVGLAPGTYNVIISNGIFSIDTSFVVMSFPGLSNLSVSVANAICSSGGAISVDSVSGSGIPYYYSLNYGFYQMDSIFSNLAAGQYILSVYDANGCQVDTLVSVVSTSNDIEIAYSITPSCSTATNNVLVNVLNPGTHTFVYYLGNDFDSSGQFSDVMSGSHMLTVVDNYGCSLDTMFTIAPFFNYDSLFISTTDQSCTNENGSFLAYYFGDTTVNSTYSFNSSLYSLGDTILGLSAGSFLFEVTDPNGCAFDSLIVIGVDTSFNVQFTLNDQVSCFEKEVSIFVEVLSADQGLTFQIANENNTSGLFEGLQPGNYTLTISNSNGCSIDTSFFVNSFFDQSGLNMAIGNSLCDQSNGTFTVLSSSSDDGLPTYIFDNQVLTEGQLIQQLNQGSYNLIVEDIHGCLYDSTIVINNTLKNPFDVSYDFAPVDCTDSTIFSVTSVTGGLAPYSFAVNQSVFTTATHYEVATGGTIDVSIEDADNCVSNYVFAVPSFGDDQELLVPNCFTPNGVEPNNSWFVTGTCVEYYHCTVVNRWGQIVFQTSDISKVWDGTFIGEPCSDGVYFYAIEAVFYSGNNKSLSGSISIIR